MTNLYAYPKTLDGFIEMLKDVEEGRELEVSLKDTTPLPNMCVKDISLDSFVRNYVVFRKEYTLEIPWGILNKQWRYAAKDLDGEVYLYTEEPWVMEGRQWTNARDLYSLTGILSKNLDPHSIAWDKSLTKRPEGV